MKERETEGRGRKEKERRGARRAREGKERKGEGGLLHRSHLGI
jgi:hypothetical protein